MNRSGGCALFKADLQDALDVGLLDKSHDAKLRPCGADAVSNIRGNRNRTGHNFSKQSAAFLVIAGLDVVRIRDIVFVTCTDFFDVHFFFLLKSFDSFTFAVRDLVARFGFFKFNSLAPFQFVIDGTCFGFQRIKVSTVRFDFGRDLTSAFQQFIDGFILHRTPPSRL